MTLTATEQKLCLTKKWLDNLLGKLVSDSYASLWINQRIKVKEQLELPFQGILG